MKSISKIINKFKDAKIISINETIISNINLNIDRYIHIEITDMKWITDINNELIINNIIYIKNIYIKLTLRIHLFYNKRE